MPTFAGFADGKTRLTKIPEAFFSDLLPQIKYLEELKVVLYFFWRLGQMEGAFRYLHRQDLTQDTRFMEGLGKSSEEAVIILDRALDQAVTDNILLEVEPAGDEDEKVYFLNSPKGRAALEAIRQNLWYPDRSLPITLEYDLERPNIYRLYEEHIGPLTPMIAEALREAEATYPPAWVDDAFRAAVENNKRSWRYVEAILKRRQGGGRDERKDRGDSEASRRRYATWGDGKSNK